MATIEQQQYLISLASELESLTHRALQDIEDWNGMYHDHNSTPCIDGDEYTQQSRYLADSLEHDTLTPYQRAQFTAGIIRSAALGALAYKTCMAKTKSAQRSANLVATVNRGI